MSRADADIQECVKCIPPADAFALVSNETRLSILEALWKADEQPVRFSTLNDAVGMRDSAQFNYHLDKLTDQYVRKTEAGYELRNAGAKIVRAIVAGSFTEHPQRGPFAIGDGCTRCGEGLVASYAEEMLAIDCPACGRGHGEYPFPPGGLQDAPTRRSYSHSTSGCVISTVSPKTGFVPSAAAECTPPSRRKASAVSGSASEQTTSVSSVTTASVQPSA